MKAGPKRSLQDAGAFKEAGLIQRRISPAPVLTGYTGEGILTVVACRQTNANSSLGF